MIALDPGDGRLRDARRVRELALREPGPLPCLAEDRPRSHPKNDNRIVIALGYQ